MELYIKNFEKYKKTYIYDFRLKSGIVGGGIGDFLKFYIIILSECINNNIKLYHKENNTEIEKYIKFKYDFLTIQEDEISNLTNVTIKKPYEYWHIKNYSCDINLNEVFYFSDEIKQNINNILTVVPNDYISIHLRLGDKFLETNKRYIRCKNDIRVFSEEKLYKFIETNINETIIFFCDNNNYKIKLKDRYKHIIVTDADIGHTSLSNTTKKQALDAVTEFYLLTKSKLIYGASDSGFSKLASMFNNVKYIN